MTSTTMPYTDGTLTLRRWRIRQAVVTMQRARRDADDEAAATVRKLRAAPAPSASTPTVVTASWPPEMLVAALIVAAVAVGGIVGLGSRYDVAALMPRRTAVVEPAAATATATAEWRDDVGEVAK